MEGQCFTHNEITRTPSQSINRLSRQATLNYVGVGRNTNSSIKKLMQTHMQIPHSIPLAVENIIVVWSLHLQDVTYWENSPSYIGHVLNR